MDQLFCMRSFARIVEQGSFARASDNLSVSKATVTKALAHLERHLGARLLHRTTRRLSLTDEGREFYERCVRILGDLAEAEDALSSSRASLRGRLRVSTPNSFVQLGFFPALEGFLARHPELSVEVVMTDRAVNLVEEGIDCALRATAIPDDANVVARHVSAVRRVTCASPAYLEAHGAPATIEDLARHNCIRFVSPSTGRALDWTFEKGSERRFHAPRGNLSVTSLDAAGAAAIAGIGIAQVSDVLVQSALREGRLRPVLAEWSSRAPSLVLVYPANRYLSAKVRAFAEFIAEVYPQQGPWPENGASPKRRSEPPPQSAARTPPPPAHRAPARAPRKAAR